MAEVGNVTVSLGLDRSPLDRQLKALSSVALKPLSLDTSLNTSALQKDLRDLQKTAGTLNIRANLDTTAARTGLRSLATTAASSIALSATLDTTAARSNLESLRGSISANINVKALLDTTGIEQQVRSLQDNAVSLSANIDTTAVRRELESISRTAATPLSLQASLDTGTIRRELTSLATTLPSLELTATVDVSDARRQIESLYAHSNTHIQFSAQLDLSDTRQELEFLTSSSDRTIALAATLDDSQVRDTWSAISNKPPRIEVIATLDSTPLRRELEAITETAVEISVIANIYDALKDLEDLEDLSQLRFNDISLNAVLDTSLVLRDLADLSLLTPTIKAVAEIDTASFKEKLGELSDIEIDCLNVCLDPDISGFKSKLEDIYKLDIDCIPVDVCLNTEDVEARLKDLTNIDATVKINTGFDAGGAHRQLDQLRARAERPLDLNVNINPFKAVLASLTGLITTPLNAIAELIVSPFKAASKSVGAIFAVLTGLVTTPLKELGKSLAAPFKIQFAPVTLPELPRELVVRGVVIFAPIAPPRVDQLVVQAVVQFSPVDLPDVGELVTPGVVLFRPVELPSTDQLIAHARVQFAPVILPDIDELLASATVRFAPLDYPKLTELVAQGVIEFTEKVTLPTVDSLVVDGVVSWVPTELPSLDELVAIAIVQFAPVKLPVLNEAVVLGRVEFAPAELPEIEPILVEATTQFSPVEPPTVDSFIVSARFEFAPVELPEPRSLIVDGVVSFAPVELPDEPLVASASVLFAPVEPPEIKDLVVQGIVRFSPVILPETEPVLLDATYQVPDLELSSTTPQINVDTNLDEVHRQLESLYKLPPLPLRVSRASFDKGFAAVLQNIKQTQAVVSFSPDLQEFNREVETGLTRNEFTSDVGLKTEGFATSIKGAFTDALADVQSGGIFSKLGAVIFAPIKLAAAAIAPIFLGLGAAIAFPLGTQLGTGITKGLQSRLGGVIGSFELVGDTAGRLIGNGINEGFSSALAYSKANAKQFVDVLEQTFGKKRLTQILGTGYRAAIEDAIREAAPGKALTQALGETEVLVESRSRRGTANSEKVARKESAGKQLGVEESAAAATLATLQQSSNVLESAITNFLTEYQSRANSLTQQQARQLQETARIIEQRKIALQQQIKEVSIRAETARAGLNTLGTVKHQSTSTQKPKDLPSVYTDVAREVASLSGIKKLDPKLIPGLKVDETLRPGTFGTYDPKSNQINISKDAHEALSAAKLDFQAIETLVHELRHAVQFGFGQIDVAAENKTGVELERATPEEIKQVGGRVERSVSQQKPELQSTARRLEADAYVFAERNSKNIQQKLQKRSATSEFESKVGIGGAKADALLKVAQTAALKKIQQINQIAVDYGIDLQEEARSALAAFSQIEINLEPLLAKARELELLSPEDIQKLQTEIQSLWPESLAAIERQPEVIKQSLIAKRQSTSSSNPVPPKEQLETRANQLTGQQLKPVAQKLGVKSRGSKVQDLRAEVLKSSTSQLQSALPAAITEVSVGIKAEADALSKMSLDAIKVRASEIHSILKQAQVSAQSLGGKEKANALKEILDGITQEQQLLKETLTRELQDDVRNFLKSQNALLGKPRRKAQTEFGVLSAQASSSSSTIPKRTIQRVSQGSGGNSFDALASFEDTTNALRSAKEQLIQDTIGGSSSSKAYSLIAEEVYKLSRPGKRKLPGDALPKLVENMYREGAGGGYNSRTNEISLPPDSYKALKGELADLSSYVIGVLVHELRHAAQYDFGNPFTTRGNIASVEENVSLLKPTREESKTLAPGIKFSTGDAESQVLQKFKGKIEADAYTFQLRYANQIEATVRGTLARFSKGKIKALSDFTSTFGAKGKDIPSQLKAKVASTGGPSFKELNAIAAENNLTDHPEYKKIQGAVSSAGGKVQDVAKKANTVESLDDKEIIALKKQIQSTLTSSAKEYQKQTAALGNFVALGLKGGVAEKTGDAEKSGKLVGAAVTKGAKKELGIQSPSSVFIAIGQNIVSGLQMGMKGMGSVFDPAVMGINKFKSKVESRKSEVGTQSRSSSPTLPTNNPPTTSSLPTFGFRLSTSSPPLRPLSREKSKTVQLQMEALDRARQDRAKAIESQLYSLKKEEFVRKRELELELERIKTQTAAFKSKGLRPKRVKPRPETVNPDIQNLEQSLQGLDALIGQIDKQQAEQMKAAVAQAKKDLAAMKQLSKATSKRVRRTTTNTDIGLKGVEQVANQEVAQIDNRQLRSQQRLDNRLRQRYGFTPSLAPGAVTPEPRGGIGEEFKSIGRGIGGVFKGIQDTRVSAAKKQAQALGQQARTVLLDIEAQIAVGRGAENQARILNADIKRNEQAINKILQAVRRSETGRGPKFDANQLNSLSNDVAELSVQIDRDSARVAALSQQSARGRSLQPQAERLRSGIATQETVGTDNDGLRTLQGANREVRNTLTELGAPPPNNPFNNINDAVAELDGGMGRLVGGAATLLKGFLAFRAVSFLQDLFRRVSVEAFQAFLEFDRLRTVLNFGSGGAAAGAKNLAFVRAEVERLRVPLGASIKGFSQLAAATRNTALEGQTTKDVFTGVSSAATVLGLSADDTAGIMTALTQVASKGKVQAEELRGQLGERIPGAFAIAARAMGTTEQELNRMLETGQVLSQDFFPRFSQQLISEFGGSAEEASKNAQSAVFAFQNAFLGLQQGMGEGIAPVVTTGINTLTVGLKILADNAQTALIAVVSLAGAALAQLAPAIVTAFNALKTFITGLAAFKAAMTGANASFGVFALQAGAIFAVIGIVAALASVVNDELAVSYENAAKRAKELADKSAGIKTPEESPEKNLGERLLEFGKGFTPVGLSEPMNVEKGWNLFQQKSREARYDASVPRIDFNDQRLIDTSNARLASLQNRTGEGKAFFDTDAQLQKAEEQRQILQSTANRDYTLNGLTIPPGVKKEISDIGLEIIKLNNKRIQVAKPFQDDLAAANEKINDTKSRLDALNDPDPVGRKKAEDEQGGPERAEQERQRLAKSLDTFRTQKEKIEAEIASLNIDPVLGLVTAFDEINRSMEQAERAAKSFATAAKTTAIRTQITTFATDPDAARKSATDQAGAEIEATQRSIDERQKLFAESQRRLAAPEIQATLQKLNITPSSNIQDIDRAVAQLDKNEKGSADQKKILEDQKNLLTERENINSSIEGLEQSRAALQTKVEQDALAVIQRTSADGAAAVQRSEATKLAAIKQRQLSGSLTEEAAAAETAKVQLASTRQNQQNNAAELAALRDRHAKGIVGEETFREKERELVTQSATLRQQAADQEIATRQTINAAVLADLEQANRKASALIDIDVSKASIGRKEQQLSLPRNEETERALGRDQNLVEIEAATKRVVQARKELADLNPANFLKDRDLENKQIELNQKLATAQEQRLDKELELQKRNQDDATFALQRRTQLEKDRGELAIQNLEDEKAALSSYTETLDRIKKLTQSKGDLGKALSGAALAASEGELAGLDKALELRPKLGDLEISPQASQAMADALGRLGVSADTSELDILNRRQQIEDNIAAQKATAQEAELRLAQELLRIDLQRERVNAQSAVLEKEVARDRAILARVEAESALYEARFIKQDAVLVEQASIRLQLNDKIVGSSQKQFEGAVANLDIQDQLAADALASLNAQQQTTRIQTESAENLREINQDITNAETQFKPAPTSSADRSDSTTVTTKDKPTKTPSLLDQARANPLPSIGQNRSGGVVELKQIHNARVDQSQSKGLARSAPLTPPDRSQSAEAELSRSLGLDPLKSSDHASLQGGVSQAVFEGEVSPSKLAPLQHAQQFNDSLIKVSNSLNALVPKPSTTTAPGQPVAPLKPGEPTPITPNTIATPPLSIEGIIGAMLSFQSELIRRVDLVNATLTSLLQITQTIGAGAAKTTAESQAIARVDGGILPPSNSHGKIAIPTLPPAAPLVLPAASQTERQIATAAAQSKAATAQPTSGFQSFVNGLREANKGIEHKLDQLNATMERAVNSPRSLHVSSPTPVTDASRILSDISYGNVVNSGLG